MPSSWPSEVANCPHFVVTMGSVRMEAPVLPALHRIRIILPRFHRRRHRFKRNTAISACPFENVGGVAFDDASNPEGTPSNHGWSFHSYFAGVFSWLKACWILNHDPLFRALLAFSSWATLPGLPYRPLSHEDYLHQGAGYAWKFTTSRFPTRLITPKPPPQGTIIHLNALLLWTGRPMRRTRAIYNMNLLLSSENYPCPRIID